LLENEARPSVGVCTVVLRDRGHVLLAKREDFEVWCLPGGALEEGESPAQAAVREVREETGLEVTLTHLVGVHTRPLWRFGATCLLVFAAVPAGGALRPQPEEVIDAGFFGGSDLPAPLFWHHRAAVAAALAGTAGAAWSYLGPSPFGEVTREELYAARDRSGLSRAAFYLRSMGAVDPALEAVEAPGAAARGDG
jgi:ADP-ribose pyrophosphatase YjhB (NUDIX family)